MIIFKTKDIHSLSRKAANIISAQIIMKPSSVLGLATGESPLGTYARLIEQYKKGDLDFSNIKTVNLDEMKNLSGDNPHSYTYYMYNNFFKHININIKNTHLPNGMAADSTRECRRYSKIIQDLGGIDLQLLGIGQNGHIGFNEPGANFEKETHLVKLSSSTINANARFFEDKNNMPEYAYTMGIKSIMQAKKIVIIASGLHKADIVKKAFFGPVTPLVPASILQFHNDVTLIGDEAVLSKIKI